MQGKEILQWVEHYKKSLGGAILPEKDIPVFIEQLKGMCDQLSWSAVEGKTIVAYSGGMGVTNAKGEPVWAWQIVKQIIPDDTELAEKSQGTYLRATEPGMVYNHSDFMNNLIEILGENAYTKVFDGRDPSTGERLPAGYSEYNGEKVQSLADYFSAQLMKQAKNTTYIFQIYLSAKAI